MKTGVILAAGKGTRMQSKIPKVLHKVLDKSMVEHVIASLKDAGVDQIVVVLGHEAEMVQEELSHHEDIQFVFQTEQLGTAHAFMQTKELIDGKAGDTIVVYGDTPLLTSKTIDDIFRIHTDENASCTVLTGKVDDATGYGRIVRDSAGELLRIVEQKDASEAEKAIQEFNSGTYCFKNEQLFERVASISANNAQGEYYLTDMIEILKDADEKVIGTLVSDLDEVMGVNDRVALGEVTKILQQRLNKYWQVMGVTIVDVQSTYIGTDVVIGKDVIIEPNVQIYGTSSIGEESFIGMNTTLINSHVGHNTAIEQSHITDSEVGNNTTVGPFARLRAQTQVGDKVRIGNFVEMKHTEFNSNSNAAHLSYLGDSTVGSGVNIGCGSVTVNYDGTNKHHTTIEDGAFIGCNTNLIAPVTIGKNAMTAAGSTITKDVPEDAMGIARGKQENKENYSKVFRNRK